MNCAWGNIRRQIKWKKNFIIIPFNDFNSISLPFQYLRVLVFKSWDWQYCWTQILSSQEWLRKYCQEKSVLLLHCLDPLQMLLLPFSPSLPSIAAHLGMYFPSLGCRWICTAWHRVAEHGHGAAPKPWGPFQLLRDHAAFARGLRRTVYRPGVCTVFQSVAGNEAPFCWNARARECRSGTAPQSC